LHQKSNPARLPALDCRILASKRQPDTVACRLYRVHCQPPPPIWTEPAQPDFPSVVVDEYPGQALLADWGYREQSPHLQISTNGIPPPPLTWWLGSPFSQCRLRAILQTHPSLWGLSVH